ncbi:MAG TPA: EfeM/EfeO family lipoprotein [Polyangia bacterium]|jgi:iron uptake system component EfeO
MKARTFLIAAAGPAALALAVAGCGGDSPQKPEDQALTQVKNYITTNLDTLVMATTQIRDTAPAADADGWNATTDAAAVTTMRTAWRQARAAYEHVEGAIAVLFPDLDVSTDERYDAFLEENGPDDNLFDDQNVTGVHAIERILWADSIRPEVVAFESKLTGYKAAAFPASAAEADDFKNKLATRLVNDVISMRGMFSPLALDPGAAYRGVIGSIGEQVEKVEKASTGEEESRYANETLADMRSNLAGGVATVDAFTALLTSKVGGAELDTKIHAGLQRLQDAYDMFPGAAIPPPPADWSSNMPSDTDLATDFGKLYTTVKKESDQLAQDSTAGLMTNAASLMGIPVLPP